MKRNIKNCILTAFSLLCLGSAAMGVCTYTNASAASGFQMLGGAFIRPVGATNTYGIRFHASHDNYNEENAYQMMVLPTEYVEQYDNDTAVDKKNIVEWMLDKKANYEAKNEGKTFPLAIVDECLYDEDKQYIYGSIVNIQYQNLNREFCAYVYYQDGTQYVVADACETESDRFRSISQVAINAISSGDFDNNETVMQNLETIVVNSIKQSQGLEETDEVSISLNSTSLKELRGATAQLTYEGLAEELIEFTSADPNVCTVDENGLVRFVGVGETKVTAEICGLTAECNVVSTVRDTEVLSLDFESDINNVKSYGGDGASVEYLSDFEGEQGVAKFTYNSQWPFMQFKPLKKMAEYADYDEIIFRMYFPKDTTNNQWVQAWKVQKNNAVVASSTNIPGNFLGDQLNTWIDIVYDAQTFIDLWTDDLQFSTSSAVPNLGGTAVTGSVGGVYYLADISVRKHIDGEVLSFDHRMDLDKIAGMTTDSTKSWVDELKDKDGVVETGVLKVEYTTSTWPQLTFMPNFDASAYADATKIVFRVYISDEGHAPIKALCLDTAINLTDTQYNVWIDLEYDISEWKNMTTAQKFWMYTKTGTVSTDNPSSCFYIAAIWVE